MMKKLLFTLVLALICSVASFAQSMSITHNVRDSYGRNCMKISCTYSLTEGGEISLVATFMDAEGNILPAHDDNFDDGEGGLCCYGGPFNVRAHQSYTTDMYMPYDVISKSTASGATNYVYFALLDEDNDGQIILESQAVNFFVRY